MQQLVEYSVDGNVAVLTIDNPPVNALSPGVPEALIAALEQAATNAAVQGVVVMGAGRTFVAGADIKEFVRITSGQAKLDLKIRRLLDVLDGFSKPVVCAIHGMALGGGLETAMACNYRVAVPQASVGQPEVKLGLIPGAGGTQRLPRLIGVAKAAEMCAGGEMVSAKVAKELGLIDSLIDGDLRTGAILFAREIIASGAAPRRACDLNERLNPKVDLPALAAIKAEVTKKARGMQAPVRAVEAIEAALQLPFAEGLAREAELFQECLYSDQSKGLVHVFLAEREVSKIPGLAKDIPLKTIARAAVVGAGTMGGGIAMNFANAGIPVLLKETDQAALDRGLGRIRSNYESSVQKGRLTQEKMDERMKLIEPTISYDRFHEADIVVEAVFEGMALKKQVFAELDKVARPDAILASNTSTLDIDQLANATSRPQLVIGHHYFSPANVMKLLEIVRGRASSPEVIATSMALSKKLGKVGVLVGNCRGFVGNRMFDPFMREAQFLVEEGASVTELDQALTQWGMAMGPMAVCDLAGIDVCWRIRQEYLALHPPGQRDVLVLDRLYENGRYGQKTGAGWYKYEGRSAVADPVVEQWIAEAAGAAGIERRRISADELVDRTILTLVNEGAKILEDGIALRALDIDIIYIYGYGFPASRGGPMFYADTIGLKKAYQRICQFHETHGPMWAPSDLLKDLAASGGSFAGYDRNRAARA